MGSCLQRECEAISARNMTVFTAHDDAKHMMT